MTITELTKRVWKEEYVLFRSRRNNGSQKYRKITKHIFWFYRCKEVRKRKERKTLSKYNRDL
jgi:hypothetical protein